MRITKRTVEVNTYHCSLCAYQDEDEEKVRKHEAGDHVVRDFRRLGAEDGEQEEFFLFFSEADFWQYVEAHNLFAYDGAWKGPGWYGLQDDGCDRPQLLAASSVLDRRREEMEDLKRLVASIEELLNPSEEKTP